MGGINIQQPRATTNPLAFQAPYSIVEIYNQLVAYQSWGGLDEMLDLSKLIIESDNYIWAAEGVPDHGSIMFDPGVTLSGGIAVPPGTFVTSVQGYNQGPGFNLKIFDKGTTASLFYTDYIRNGPMVSNMQLSVPGENTPFGPGLLSSPFIVTPPGQIGWEITNADTANPQQIQILICMAQPITAVTIGHQVISRG